MLKYQKNSDNYSIISFSSYRMRFNTSIRESIYFQYLMLIFINTFLKISYFNLPLNRDTGTFLYAGQEILRGKIMYVDFFDHKPPLSYLFASVLIKLLGSSVLSIRLFVLITVIISSILVYQISMRFTNSKTIGNFSGIIYSLFISMPSTWSFEFMTTNLMELFGLFSIYLVVKYKNWQAFFISGAMVILSALSKQPGILFFIIVIFLICIQILLSGRQNIKYSMIFSRLIYFICGSLLIIIALLLTLFLYDNFWQFYYWVISRNFVIPASDNLFKLTIFLDYVLPDNFLLYSVSICSVVLFYLRFKKNKIFYNHIFSLCFFWIATFILYFTQAKQIQPHYFYSLVAPLSIISALFFERIYTHNKKLFILFSCIFIIIFLINYTDQVEKFRKELLTVHAGADFKTQLEVASDIMRVTNYNQKILVLFSSPEYYFLSNREASISYPQFNINYVSDSDKTVIIKKLIWNRSQKVIVIRKNDWGSSEDIIKYIKEEYTLLKGYKSYDEIEIYIMKN